MKFLSNFSSDKKKETKVKNMKLIQRKKHEKTELKNQKRNFTTKISIPVIILITINSFKILISFQFLMLFCCYFSPRYMWIFCIFYFFCLMSLWILKRLEKIHWIRCVFRIEMEMKHKLNQLNDFLFRLHLELNFFGLISFKMNLENAEIWSLNFNDK